MTWRIDARVPVSVTDTLPPLTAGTALLAEGALPPGLPPDLPAAVFERTAEGEQAAHPAACLCCRGQGAAAAALAALFRARATGGPWFDRVVALVRTPAGRAEVEEALTRDILTLARYRRA
ncbi:MAG: hypothetical protein N2588_10250 [Rhodovarius sp.]|nr:hypothetical protein [Rhodovarius sp.]